MPTAMAAMATRRPPPSFSALFSIGPVQEALFETLTRPQLLKLVRTLSTECRDWVDAELRHADASGLAIRPADLAAGLQVPLLQHFVRIEGARVLLPAAEYLLEGDRENAAHLLNELRPARPADFGRRLQPRGSWQGEDGAVRTLSQLHAYTAYNQALAAHRRWEPEWRQGYGPLCCAADVTLVGEEGVVIEGDLIRLEVETKGVHVESLHLPMGVDIRVGGSLTLTKCVSTGRGSNIAEKASLVMVDSRVFGCGGSGVGCAGKMKATRCTFEENDGFGVYVDGEKASAELVDCVIHKNDDGLVACYGAKVALRGGTVSGNKGGGVVASDKGSKVTVSKEQPTVCKNNERHDWATEGRGVLEGVAEEKITRWNTYTS